MGTHKLVSVFFFQLLLVLLVLESSNAQYLKQGFYTQKCPDAEAIVTKTTHHYISRAPTLAAALLRMHFHDCFVRVCCLLLALFYYIYPHTHIYIYTRIQSISYLKILDEILLTNLQLHIINRKFSGQKIVQDSDIRDIDGMHYAICHK